MKSILFRNSLSWQLGLFRFSLILALFFGSTPASFASTPTLLLSQTNGINSVSWSASGFVLESTATANGTWAPVSPAPASPYTLPVGDSTSRFYRLREEAATVTHVTVQGYTNDAGGNFIAAGDPLVYEVKAGCQTWTREARGGGMDTISGPHTHYNAATDVTFVDGTLTWTEYGPEHSQAEIDATCAAGTGGVVKTANDSSYTEHQPGLFLRVTSTTSSTTNPPPVTTNTVTHVTVQGYTNDAGGNFIAAGEPLVYEVKAGCQTWTREARGGGMDTISGPHTHYNAATDVSFVDGTLTWTEYGPEHSQAEIDATCAAGTGGVVKTANDSGYTEHQPGLFLRVTSTTNSTTNPPPVTTNTVTHVTVQGYTNDAGGNFIAAGDPLVYEVKAGCQTWTREARGGGMDTISGPHTHYNAATDVTFVDGTLTWTEFGPEHSQEEIDATCAAGTGGVVKTANDSGYTEHQPGLFLRVTSTTNSTTSAPITTNVVSRVTVQGYTNDMSGGFVAAGDPLVYEVKAGCQTWTREARGGGMDTISGPHTHYNAATDVTFVDGTLTWTEYGPEHSQAEIDATCAAGTGGVVKTANDSGYTEHQPGLFLRVTNTE